ncbi:hypothetical protein [Alkalibacillus salilacus]|uniref:CBS domain containing-hemolysin-like protein n=1 Tax=Alkalibacillus salilacus TaxID=284582 RepID=A0ABT9VCD8_9BACI|nr:hypothetical protein [Alkalibacillus salilacus]MDQ0158582.1 CBS domain containing-hemolysin-like protein [Alkalibacillus salilacus]
MLKIIKESIRFSISIAVITFVLAAIFSIVSQGVLGGVNWFIGMIIVLTIVLIGVLSDMLGIAATAASEKPFHSMASEKVYGAKNAIRIVRNADKFATFCNDVIGDIAGVISGTASTLVVIQLATVISDGDISTYQFVIGIIFTSLVAALTVGGKALGKSLAVRLSTDLVLFAGKVTAIIEDTLRIRLLPSNKKQ